MCTAITECNVKCVTVSHFSLMCNMDAFFGSIQYFYVYLMIFGVCKWHRSNCQMVILKWGSSFIWGAKKSPPFPTVPSTGFTKWYKMMHGQQQHDHHQAAQQGLFGMILPPIPKTLVIHEYEKYELILSFSLLCCFLWWWHCDCAVWILAHQSLEAINL